MRALAPCTLSPASRSNVERTEQRAGKSKGRLDGVRRFATVRFPQHHFSSTKSGAAARIALSTVSLWRVRGSKFKASLLFCATASSKPCQSVGFRDGTISPVTASWRVKTSDTSNRNSSGKRTSWQPCSLTCLVRCICAAEVNQPSTGKRQLKAHLKVISVVQKPSVPEPVPLRLLSFLLLPSHLPHAPPQFTQRDS